MHVALPVKPSLAVVIPNRNDEQFLGDCLKSVLNQSVPPDEIIFVDDCSSDASFNLACQLLSGARGVTLLRSDKHIGTMKALNLGLTRVASDYVLFLSSNDYLKNKIIESAKESIAREDRIIGVWSAMVLIDNPNVANLKVHASAKISNKTKFFNSKECIDFLNKLGNWFTGTTMFFNTEKLREMSGFDPRFMGLADLFAAMILSSKYGAIFSPQIHGVMRVHPGGLLSKTLNHSEIFPMIETVGKKLSPNLFTEAYINKMRSRLAYTVRMNSQNLSMSVISNRKNNNKFNKFIKLRNLNRITAFVYFIRLRPFDILSFAIFRLYPNLLDHLKARFKFAHEECKN